MLAPLICSPLYQQFSYNKKPDNFEMLSSDVTNEANLANFFNLKYLQDNLTNTKALILPRQIYASQEIDLNEITTHSFQRKIRKQLDGVNEIEYYEYIPLTKVTYLINIAHHGQLLEHHDTEEELLLIQNLIPSVQSMYVTGSLIIILCDNRPTIFDDLTIKNLINELKRLQPRI
jgi:hypothetical protein